MSAVRLHGFTATKLKLVLGAAAAFVTLTLFEVVTQREDWPFSCYPMYSRPVRRVAERTVIVGVSTQGEFPLTPLHTHPYNGSRLLATSRKLLRDPAQARAFARIIGERYGRRRGPEGWPLLQAIRMYSETWNLRPRLAGIDHPSRSLASALYVPPPALLARLQAEAGGNAPLLPAVRVARTDHVFDLAPGACEGECGASLDRYAAGGSALLLAGNESRGSVTLRVKLDRRKYAVFLRMKRLSETTGDRLSLSLDGETVGEEHGLGNYALALPDSAWVWASAKPGWPARRFEVETPGEHVLELSATERVLVDQLWLSATARELPIDNAPRDP